MLVLVALWSDQLHAWLHHAAPCNNPMHADSLHRFKPPQDTQYLLTLHRSQIQKIRAFSASCPPHPLEKHTFKPKSLVSKLTTPHPLQTPLNRTPASNSRQAKPHSSPTNQAHSPGREPRLLGAWLGPQTLKTHPKPPQTSTNKAKNTHKTHSYTSRSRPLGPSSRIAASFTYTMQ